MRRCLIVSSIAVLMAGFTPGAHADQAVSPAILLQSGGLPIELAASAARRERMMIIQENLDRQRNFDPGYDRGYEGYIYGPRYYTPPRRWAPAYDDRWDDDWDED